MSQNPVQDAARRKEREKKLGPNAVCFHCGETQWETLMPVRKSLMEAHHIFGRANDAEFTEALCRNCHAILTEHLQQCGVSMKKPRTFLDLIAAILAAVGSLLTKLGEKFLSLAQRL